MTTMNKIKKIVHKLHLDDLAKSMEEFRKDNMGGFLIPVSVKITDPEYRSIGIFQSTGR